MKFFNSLFKKSKRNAPGGADKEERRWVRPEISVSVDEAIRRSKANNEALAAIYEQQVLPIKDALIGKTISSSMSGPVGFALFFTDGSWLAAYLVEKTTRWKMGEAASKELVNDWLNNSSLAGEFEPFPEEKTNELVKNLATTHGKKIVSISSGLIHAVQYVKFSFPDHGELFTMVGPRWNSKIPYWLNWRLPMKLYWRGEAIGFLLDQDDDMGLWDGVWDACDSEHAREFEQFALQLDPKAVIRDLRLGTLLEW